MECSKTKTSKRFEYIDSLRGIAAVLVLILHFYLLNIEQNIKSFYVIDQLIFGVLDFGKIGVTIFFLISGFVIPSSLRKNHKNVIGHFFISRIFRLYPLYWMSIIIILCLNSQKQEISQILFNITMFQKFFGVNDLLGVFWTLQIEWVFYGLIAFLYYINKLDDIKNIKTVIHTLMVVSLIFSYFRWIYAVKIPIALFLGLMFMFLGYLWRKMLIDKEIKGKDLFVIVRNIIITILPICFLAYNYDFGFHERWYRYYFSYLTAMILFFIFTKLVLIKWEPIVFMGKISYSIYLMHAIVGMSILNYLIGLKISIYACNAMAFIITLLVSIFTYYFIEKPAINFSKKFIKKYLCE